MRLSVLKFRGEYPIVTARLLPPDMSTTCINAKLQSGDFDGFQDFGAPLTLAKSAPINTIWQLTAPDLSTHWMSFSQSEVQTGQPDIDLALGTVADDTTSRFFITGSKYRYTKAGPVADSTPQQTNKFYSTDSSQQGSNPAGAYPYVTFDLGIANPTAIPSVTTAAIVGPTTNFEYAAEANVNNVSVNAAGANYVSGTVLSLIGGTLGVTGYPARVLVNDVTATGAIDTTKIGAFSLIESGFYKAGLTPSSPAGSTASVGSGATFNITPGSNSFNGFNAPSGDNGAGSYVHWTITSNKWQVGSGQGDLNVAYSTHSFNLAQASSFILQADMATDNGGAGEFADLVTYLTGTYNGNTPPGNNIQLNGPAIVLSKNDSTLTLYTGITGTNGGTVSIPSGASQVGQVTGLSISGNTMYRVTASCVASTNSSQTGFSITVTLALQATPSTIIATLSGFIPYAGEQIGFGSNHRNAHNNYNEAQFENILMAVTQPASSVTAESTNYVETDVDSFNDESGPSDPSVTITVAINTTENPNIFGPVTITLAPTPSAVDVQIRNIYRAVNLGGTNEVYQLVTGLTAMTLSGATGAFAVGSTVTGATTGSTGVVQSLVGTLLILNGVTTAFAVGETLSNGTFTATYASSANSTTTITYTDSFLDSALGADLQTTDWAPPPANLQGIAAAPNEIMVGYIAGTSTLCLSVPGHPHAWPVKYQRTVDYPIVADAIRNNDVVILTTGVPYTAFGDDPDPTTGGFSMNREGSAQGCVSKRSVAVHRVYGVIYASTNGFVAYRGQSMIDLIRITDAFGQQKPIFTQQQYLALNPSSIIGAIHDDFYYFWYDNGTKKGGYLIDLDPDGFGLVELDFHVTSVFNDPTSGHLYVTPDFSVYAINGSIVSSAQNVISQWDQAATKRAKTWARNYWLFDRPMSFNVCRVRAADFTSVNLVITNESGQTAFSGAVSSNAAFVIGAIPPGMRWQATLTGTSVVLTVELGEAVEDLLSLQ